MKTIQTTFHVLGRAGILLAFFLLLASLACPVTASTCHPGYVVPTYSGSFQYTPTFSTILTTNPSIAAMNINPSTPGTITFNKPSFGASFSGSFMNGKTFTSCGW